MYQKERQISNVKKYETNQTRSKVINETNQTRRPTKEINDTNRKCVQIDFVWNLSQKLVINSPTYRLNCLDNSVTMATRRFPSNNEVQKRR